MATPGAGAGAAEVAAAASRSVDAVEAAVGAVGAAGAPVMPGGGGMPGGASPMRDRGASPISEVMILFCGQSKRSVHKPGTVLYILHTALCTRAHVHTLWIGTELNLNFTHLNFTSKIHLIQENFYVLNPSVV